MLFTGLTSTIVLFTPVTYMYIRTQSDSDKYEKSDKLLSKVSTDS